MQKLIVLATVVIIGIVLFASFTDSNSNQKMPINNNPNLAEWKTIDSLDQQGLPESAEKKVQALYKIVQTENNGPQIVKCLIYQARYFQGKHEEGSVNALQFLEDQIVHLKGEGKSVAQFVLGKLYLDYLNNGRWLIGQRTEVDETDQDIATWTTRKFLERAKVLILGALNAPNIKKIKLKEYTAILNQYDGKMELRPTLYDFLAHQAISYFVNTSNTVSEAVTPFLFNDPKLFGSATEFINLDLNSTHKNSGIFQATKILQDLLAFHIDDSDQTAMVDAEVARMQFLHQHANPPGKEQLYLTALDRLTRMYGALPGSAEFSFLLASHYQNKASSNGLDIKTRDQEGYLKAIQIAEEAASKFKDSYGGSLCTNLIFNIKQKQFNLQLEETVLPNEEFLVGIRVKNINMVTSRILSVSDTELEKFKRLDYDQRKNYLLGLKSLHEWTNRFEYKEDHHFHFSEIPVHALPSGTYFMLTENGDKISGNKILNYTSFKVSSVAIVDYMTNDSKNEFLILNRKTGAPLVNAKVSCKVWAQNGNRSSVKDVLTETVNTDGFVSFSTIPRHHSYSLQVITPDENYSPANRFYSKNRDNTRDRSSSQVHFFLDRKIYRPGQTIHFKGIAIDYDERHRPSLKTNESYEIKLNDPNGQEQGKLTLKTNEYGSFSGSFIAPSGGLLGNFYVTTSEGSVHLRVEEYKRPKFEVNIEPSQEATSLDEMVKVSGKAMAFAGYPIDNAKVSYRITRTAYFPWCGWWRARRYGNRVGAEIANGMISTDDKGSFDIGFVARGDQSIDANDRPEYNFQISVDVTDGTGETRSTSYALRAGTIGYRLSHNLPETIELDSLNEIKVFAENLNGAKISADVEVEIVKLTKPQSIFKKRNYSEPDLFVLSKSEFKKRFPLQAYRDEDQPYTWPISKISWKESWTTDNSSGKDLRPKKWTAGTYKVILKGKDATGNKVEKESIHSVYNSKDLVIPGTDFVWHPVNAKNYSPSDQFNFQLYAKQNTKLHYTLTKRDKSIQQGWLSGKGLLEITQAIAESHRGGMNISVIGVIENQKILYHEAISIPWTNKNLSIKTSSFRNKVYPGAKEEWSFTISGEQKEVVAAEFLATMYDASLDAFAPNTYSLSPWPIDYSYYNSNFIGFGANGSQSFYGNRTSGPGIRNKYYSQLNLFGLYLSPQGRGYLYENREQKRFGNLRSRREKSAIASEAAPVAVPEMESMDMSATTMMDVASDDLANSNGTSDEGQAKAPPVRTNLDETVFFFPQLKTDENGALTFTFIMNEALTKWKLLLLGHDKELRTGQSTMEVVTQKELMVVPNPPRFFREGDQIEFTAKLVNLTDEPFEGNIEMELENAVDNKSLNSFIKDLASKTFSLAGKASETFSWTLNIPKEYLPGITHRIIATSGKYSDGEQETRPVLTNRTLVTETFPMPVNSNEQKDFTFNRIPEVQRSSTATAHQFTVEFTSNPVWYGVLALPYLMEYPYKCSEQIFSRFYANTIASGVANKYPKIRSVFNALKNTDALESNLQKNESLKSALLEETPWVLEAENEATQRKQIGILFDLNRMANEQSNAMNTLINRQMQNGGLAWFPDGRASRYITQYIIQGFGHLNAMNLLNVDQKGYRNFIRKGINYLDTEFVKSFEELKKNTLKNGGKLDPNKNYLRAIEVHYLYTRTFFDQAFPDNAKEALDFYNQQIEKYWLSTSLISQAQIALIAKRTDRTAKAMDILKSLRERSLKNEELGMYWKSNSGMYWYNNYLEAHSYLMEAFNEVDPNQSELDALSNWLLKNKQTNAWETTKSTALAVYALLVTGGGGEQLANSQLVNIKIGGVPMLANDPVPGMGYVKTSFPEVPKNGHQISIDNPNTNIAWGAAYFQYFEDLDQITDFAETPLTIQKEVYKETITDQGPKLTLIKGAGNRSKIIPGDRLKVRIIVKVDRDMEFVHLKDGRGSGLEPENVLSGYRWQGRLGYYEATKDASTNFFIDYLPKGTHVFEYPLRAVHKGNFSNGITTMQSMYAPEFSSHSKGIRITIE